MSPTAGDVVPGADVPALATGGHPGAAPTTPFGPTAPSSFSWLPYATVVAAANAAIAVALGV